MMKQFSSSALLGMIIIFLLVSCTSISGQSPAPALAPSGSSSGPADIIAVLQKAGDFTTFIGLLKGSQVDSLINTQLKKPGNGFTVFAPTDNAFSELKTGTLNSFSDDQKAALTKFHVLPTFLTIAQFQTVSNPVHTSAGGDLPLNVVGNGTHVNMTTGLVNTTVDSTVYSDGQLAVYEIPQVLLSQGIISPQAAPAPAPLPGKPKTKTIPKSEAPSLSTATASVDSSRAMPQCAPAVVSIGGVILGAFAAFCLT